MKLKIPMLLRLRAAWFNSVPSAPYIEHLQYSCTILNTNYTIHGCYPSNIADEEMVDTMQTRENQVSQTGKSFLFVSKFTLWTLRTKMPNKKGFWWVTRFKFRTNRVYQSFLHRDFSHARHIRVKPPQNACLSSLCSYHLSQLL